MNPDEDWARCSKSEEVSKPSCCPGSLNLSQHEASQIKEVLWCLQGSWWHIQFLPWNQTSAVCG